MRDIIFRGIPKTEDIPEGLKENMIGEYVYGFLVKEGGSAYIVGNVVDVDSDYIALDYWTEVNFILRNILVIIVAQQEMLSKDGKRRRISRGR
jgi:hypothetical protein